MKKKCILCLIILLLLFILTSYFMHTDFISHTFTREPQIMDLTNDQLKNYLEDSSMIPPSEQKTLVIFPESKQVKMQIAEDFAIGIGIRNLLRDSNNSEFSYDVIVEQNHLDDACNIDPKEIEEWIIVGREKKMVIPPGESEVNKIIINVPDNITPCSFTLRILVSHNGKPYATDSIQVRKEIPKPKEIPKSFFEKNYLKFVLIRLLFLFCLIIVTILFCINSCKKK